MHGKIEENRRYRIVEQLIDALSKISRANGYNTQPLVTTDYREIQKSDASAALWIEETDEDVFDIDTSLGMSMNFTINIVGNVLVKGKKPHRERNMLLQDVRNCLSEFVKDLSKAGIPTAYTLGTATSDDSELTENNLAMFSQPLTLQYKIYNGKF